jgi:hypothetical protein
MPRTETLHCPSGLAVVVRSRKTRDYSIINSEDRDAVRRYNESVVMQTVDRGPYGDDQFYDDGRPRQLKGFLTADYWAIRLKHHQLNKPDKPFVKKFQCDGDKCGYEEQVRLWMGDENSDGRKGPDGIYYMRAKPLSDASAAIFREKNLYETELGGKRVEFKLSDMDTLERFRRYVKRNNVTGEGERAIVITACRIVRVEGVQESLQSHIDWYGSLDDDESDELLDKMEEPDCGVDWELFPWCPRCDEEKYMYVDVDDNFFSRGRQKRRTASRA